MFQLHNKKEIFYNAWGGVGRHFVCLNLWGPIEGRRWKASTRRHREALDVSMMGGLICAVTPPNASKVNSISVVIFFDQGYHSKFTIIKIMF